MLRAYRSCPATVGHLLRNDRRLALKLFESAVPIDIVEAALAIAALRRAYRPADAPPLPKVRSLAYFLPVIDELMASPLEPGYLDYLACKLCSLTPHKDR